MPASTKSDVPDLLLKIDGSPVAEELYADLVDVTVKNDEAFPSTLTLRLVAWDAANNQVAWVDDDLFSIGKAVEVQLGYMDAVSPVIQAEITGLDLDLSAGDTPRLTVTATDRRHRLQRGSQTRCFVKMTESDIAKDIAKANHLDDSGVVATKDPVPYVLQNDQSDLEFLKMRAAAISYEVLVEDKTLLFRPAKTDQRPAITLSADAELTELSIHLTSAKQVGTVEVRGWDVMNKTIVGKASSGDEGAMGGTGGPGAADDAFGKATLTLSDLPIFDQATADDVARGVFKQLALGFVVADGSCLGRTDLVPGAVVNLRGFGTRFSGDPKQGSPYYVTSVTHRYSPQQGYRTSFSARRNAT